MTTFELLDSISLPGHPEKPNDDAFASQPNAAVIMDGATGLGEPLMPGDSDAAWLARFGARRLMAHIRDGDAPLEAIRRAMEDSQQSFEALRKRAPRETYEIPFASIMLIVATEPGFEAFWFGDCAALVRRPNEPVTVIGEAAEKRALEAERVAKLAQRHGLSPAAGHNRPEYLEALRRARNYANTEKGGWIFGPDPRVADHVATQEAVAPTDSLVLLATDGFLALSSDYRRYDSETLIEAAADIGLAKLGAELREIEGTDLKGTRYPRFKTSDDATALLLRVA